MEQENRSSEQKINRVYLDIKDGLIEDAKGPSIQGPADGKIIFNAFKDKIDWKRKNIFVFPKRFKLIGPSFFTGFFEEYSLKEKNPLSTKELIQLFDFEGEEDPNDITGTDRRTETFKARFKRYLKQRELR